MDEQSGMYYLILKVMIIIEPPGFMDEAVIILPQSLESFYLFAEPLIYSTNIECLYQILLPVS